MVQGEKRKGFGKPKQVAKRQRGSPVAIRRGPYMARPMLEKRGWILMYLIVVLSLQLIVILAFSFEFDSARDWFLESNWPKGSFGINSPCGYHSCFD